MLMMMLIHYYAEPGLAIDIILLPQRFSPNIDDDITLMFIAARYEPLKLGHCRYASDTDATLSSCLCRLRQLSRHIIIATITIRHGTLILMFSRRFITPPPLILAADSAGY